MQQNIIAFRVYAWNLSIFSITNQSANSKCQLWIANEDVLWIFVDESEQPTQCCTAS